MMKFVFGEKVLRRLRQILVAVMVMAVPVWADGGANHQVRNLHFGVSGGNVNDASKAFCCGGTLGALVIAGGNLYILSNNHVLGRSDQAIAGEDVTQPGLIDNGCRPATTVADFTVAPLLGSNVDAAIAALRSGQMDSSGFIEDIGVPSSMVKAASIGLAVAKSGRTTGFTTGTISSINATVSVQYQRGCGGGKKFVVNYTNQIVTGHMSAGGDSGSLLVTNDSCHQPVGLLFAGSSSTTIYSPIGEVLTKLGTALGGSTVSFVGTTCGSASTGSTSGPSASLIEHASRVVNGHAAGLMHGPVIGVGVGAADENSAEAVLVIYIDRTHGVLPDLPAQVEGVRTKRVFTDPFVAQPGCSSCANSAGSCKD
jgi:hypothetical protein